MKNVFAIGGGLAAFVVVAIGLVWIFQGNEFFMYRWFAPKYEDVRRETFEHSKAYRQGAVQELQNMQFEYAKADDAHKDALASIILHRAADLDEEVMPPDLRAFIHQLKQERAARR
jgi:hypothetical protein